MMWRCGVMGGIARGIDAMPLQFYDMSLGRYYFTLLHVFVNCCGNVATYTATLMNHCVKMTLQ